MDVAAASGEIDDGIADELAGPVVGHVTAAIDPQDRGVRLQHVALVSTAPDRDHRRVLDQDEPVGITPQHGVASPRLDGQHLVVGSAPEPFDVERPRGIGAPREHHAWTTSTIGFSSSRFSSSRKCPATTPSMMR